MKYNDLMNSISVDSDMKSRVLKNVRSRETFEVLQVQKKKITPLKNIYKYSGLAACLVLAFLLGYHVRLNDNITVVEQNVEILQDTYSVSNAMASNIVEYDSIEELQDSVDFVIKNIESVPFIIKKSEYRVYWGNLIEIKYIGEDTEVIYRITKGFSDISGNFMEFDDIVEVEENDTMVTLKGNSKNYQLALWSKDGLSYSLYISKPIQKDSILKILTYNE